MDQALPFVQHQTLWLPEGQACIYNLCAALDPALLHSRPTFKLYIKHAAVAGLLALLALPAVQADGHATLASAPGATRNGQVTNVQVQ